MDQALWQHIAGDDQLAYAEVYTYYYKRLFNYGKKFTEETAVVEDAIQEAFVSLWNYRKRLFAIKSPTTYLFHTFRNTLFYKLRQEQKRHAKEKTQVPEPEFNAEHLIVRKELDAVLRRQLEEALKALPARQREAIFLRFYEGLPYEQIAEVMGISVNSTYKTISKAILHLRDAMGLPVAVILVLLRYAG